jgi:CRP/FNR family cyclic AMP-dependent transcriptional regulator
VSSTRSVRGGGVDESLQRPEPGTAIGVWDPAGTWRDAEAGAVSALIKQLRRCAFVARQTIFTEGDPGDRVFIIGRGKVKISLRGPDSRVNLLAILGPSDIFGELAIFDPGPRTCTATAITDIEALWLDRATLRTWMTDRPVIAEWLLQMLAQRLRHTEDELVELICGDVPRRVARQLLLLAQRFGTPEGDALRVVHELTPTEMAQLAGTDPASANKAQQDFVSRGWIRVEDKTLLIVDRDALARRASISSRAYPSRRRLSGRSQTGSN